MSALIVVNQQTQTTTNIVTTSNGAAIPLNGAMTLSVQCNVDVNTPSNKTFAAAAVNTGTDTITLASHGYTTGLKVQFSNPGALPTGISALTDYFLIVLTANTFQVASSLANALAGTAIDITAQGSGTNTVEVTALAGASVKLQVSNDAGTPETWSDVASATSITTDAVIYLSSTMASTVPPTGNWARVVFTLTAGRLSSSNVVVVKGFY